MMDYTKLFLDSISLSTTVSSLTALPRFKCPECGYVWGGNQVVAAPSNRITDFNQKIAFKCPKCNSTITLFVAVHRDINLTSLCLQKSSEEGASGIPANWWVHQ